MVSWIRNSVDKMDQVEDRISVTEDMRYEFEYSDSDHIK